MAYTEFFVTHGAGASDANGGGPSLGAIGGADGPVVQNTNCSTDGAGTTVTDDDSNGWAAASVDDWICFDTAGTKEATRITNIAGDALTVSPQISASAAGKTVNAGGAFAAPQRPVTILAATYVNAASDPIRVNIKADSAFTGAGVGEVEMNNSGTLALPITFQGYTTNPGDGGMAEIDGDGLSNHTGTWDCNAKNNFVLRDLYVHGDQANIDGIYALACSYLVIHRCKVLATSYTADSITVDGALGFVVDDCWVTDAGRDGLVTGSYGSATNNRIDSAGRYGIRIPTTGRISCRGNIVNSSVNHGIYVTNDFSEISHNYIYDSGASGIYFADLTSEWPGLVSNNIFDNCGSTSSHYGIEVASGQEYLKMIKNNAFFDCGDDVYPAAATQETQGVLEVFDSVTLTDSPATTPGTDFRLKATGGGLQCKDTGFPGIAIWAN